MVTISIENGFVNFDVEGLDKLWSFRSRLTIPIEHIRSARVDTEAARGWWHGLRLMGTSVPGILTAGSFYEHGGMVFYDVHDPDNTIVIEVDHERYQRLIVEVEDPLAVVKELERVIPESR
jgi:PH (Pleckstrin Homology) domain-containing protein